MSSEDGRVPAPERSRRTPLCTTRSRPDGGSVGAWQAEGTVSKSLAQKVDWLFEHRPTERGRQYTYGAVQRATGDRITASYVWKLRTGAMSNPSLASLEALAGCFDVPLAYFAEGGEYLEPSLSIIKSVPDDKLVRDVTLDRIEASSSKLPHDKLGAVVDVIAYLRHHEPAGTR
jgi:transcriptional regulator with XRE-family HTH domain